MMLDYSICLSLSVAIQSICALSFHTDHYSSTLQKQRISSSSLDISRSYVDQLSSGQSEKARAAQEKLYAPALEIDTSYDNDISSNSGISYTPPDYFTSQVVQETSHVPSLEVAPTSFEVAPASTTISGISYASPDYFALSNLQSKGLRKTDWGIPNEASRGLDDDGILRVGAWYCSEGGWPSPNPKAHTEIFYVLEGRACLADADGMMHTFGPGDVSIFRILDNMISIFLRHFLTQIL